MPPTTTSPERKFPYLSVLAVSAGHFIHDTFSAFLAPLLPWLIEQFSLTYTEAGALTAFLQAPSALNPFIGYLSEGMGLRYFAALAPAFTATGMVLLGLMPNYWALAGLLLVTGFSVAAFHASAPALIAHLAPRRTGRGMSFFMAGGELGRVVGPTLAVWAVGLWGLTGLPRLLVLGWGTSLVLFWQVRRIQVHIERHPIGELWPILRKLALPLTVLVLGRSMLLGALGTFLPTFLAETGLSKAQSGLAFAWLYEAFGVVGALVVGSLSDKIGRRPVIVGAVLASGVAAAGFLLSQTAWRLVWLPLLGFSALSFQPALMALVQDYAPRHRATANGTYLALSFLARPVAVLLVGFFADLWSLQWAFAMSAAAAVLALLALLGLPALPHAEV